MSSTPNSDDDDDTSNVASLEHLFSSLVEMCTVADNIVSANDQISAIYPSVHKFAEWHSSQFVPAIARSSSRTNAKSLELAFKYQKLAEGFIELHRRDQSYPEQAFYYLNKAIKLSPFDESNFLCQCFALRCELHVKLEDFNSGLCDIEKALHLRPHSFSAIVTKVSLMIDLNCYSEAYGFIKRFLNTENADKMSENKREQLRLIKDKLCEYASSEDEEVEDDSIKEQEFIRIDNRVRVTKDKHNHRYGLIAVENIEANVLLIREVPGLLVLKKDGLQTICAKCLKNCKNTFWSCSNCTELIYCSDKCARNDVLVHSAECGIIGLMMAFIEAHGSQVYRHLALLGHEQLLEVDREVHTFCLEKCLNQIQAKSVQSVSFTSIEEWFAFAQSDLIHRQYQFDSKRTPNQLATAIFLLSLYLHKRHISIKDITTSQLIDLVRILSTHLSVAYVNQYVWNERDLKGKRSLASFQCLISSRVCHSCQSNAEWNFDGQRFILRSSNAIESGEAITISFGVNTSDPFLVRQATLSQLNMTCACVHCITDSAKHFCLRCSRCDGPVPWHESQPISRCMRCEHKLDNIEHAKTVQRDLESFHRIIWLYKNSKCTEDELRSFDFQMTSLSQFIDPHNEQFLCLFRELTELYLSRYLFDLAVPWHQWFATDYEIYLSSSSNNQLDCFHSLDQWTTAYAHFLEHTNSDAVLTMRMRYCEIGSKLVGQMFVAIEQWQSTVKTEVISGPALHQLNMDYQQVVCLMTHKAKEKMKCFAQVSMQIINELIRQDMMKHKSIIVPNGDRGRRSTDSLID